MFEAVIAICAAATGTPCRDALLPGYEAATRQDCEAALVRNPPTVSHQQTPHCQPVGPALDFDEVAPGVFVHVGQIEEANQANRGDVSNIGFVIGAESVAVIDSGTAAWMGEGIWRAIRARTDLPIRHVILTHMHPDHVFGASVFGRAGAEIVGQRGLSRALADRQSNYLESLDALVGVQDMLGTSPPAISVAVDQVIKIDLGDRELTLTPWQTAHTEADLTVLDEVSGTFFAGDLIFHRHTPALDGKLRGWQSVLSQLALIEAAQVVPGHGGPVLPWPNAIDAMQRYLDRLASDTEAAIAAGERLSAAITHIAQSEAPNWSLFDAFNPRNATVAFTELEWE